MPELIEKAKVLKYLTPRIKAETPLGEAYNRALEDAAALVALLPTIEAEPVRHGRWIKCEDQYNVDNDNGNYAYYCSCCKYQDIHAESAKVSFCWNCGSDMREEGADNG